jgi:heme exporter protein D
LSFDNFSDFFAMGGHGVYVWLSYGMGIIIFAIAFIQPLLQRKTIIKELAQRNRRAQQERDAIKPNAQ